MLKTHQNLSHSGIKMGFDTLIIFMLYACDVRQNQVHEVIRLCCQTSWDPQHWDGHGGKLTSFLN